jgi:DNA-binding FrmR family transcriptional regulator
MGYSEKMKLKVKTALIRRLRIIGGQLKGLEKMILTDKYYTDIIHQSLAIKQALSGAENLILENHLATHVVEKITGKTNRAAQEILEIFKFFKRK